MSVFEKNNRAPSIYTIMSSTFYVAVGLAIKKIKGIPASEILFFRSVICYIANYALIRLNKVPIYAPTDKLHFMVMFRCLFGTIAHFCYYQAISMMNLSDAMAIFLTTPIVTTVLAAVFLKEGLKKEIIFSILVSFLGILLIVKPPFILKALGFSNVISELTVVGLVVCAVFALFESLTNLVIKALGKQMSVLSVI
jgi:drug/metabolite transporter (DMT)-like permease